MESCQESVVSIVKQNALKGWHEKCNDKKTKWAVIFPSEFRGARPKQDITAPKSMTNVKMYDYATPNEKHKNTKPILYVYVKV